MASDEKLEIALYEIIYKLIEEIEIELDKIKVQETIRIQLGEIQVLAIFRHAPRFMIIGGKISKGKAVPETMIKIMRQGKLVDYGRLTELQCNKEIVSEAVAGQECGLKYEGRPQIQVGDVLEIFQEKKE
jgi:translation initiation factor IF-2